MGQYYKIVNLRDRQFLYPHAMGDGLKLLEFGMSGRGTLSVLAAAIANTREHKGAWTGANLVVAGDYADTGRFVPESAKDMNLYAYVASDPQTGQSEGGYVDASKPLTGVVEPLFGVEVREDFSSNRSGAGSRFLRGLAARNKLKSLEDLFELLDEAINPNNATRTAENLLRGLRVANVQSHIAWHRAKARWVVDEGKTWVLQTTLLANGSIQESAGTTFELKFPMTAPQLARQLGFLAQWNEHASAAMSTKPASRTKPASLGRRHDVSRPDLFEPVKV